MSNILVPKSRIVEAACRTDFLSFFRWCFHVLEPGSILNMNWHHYAMAYYLELVLRGLVRRLIIAAPPRTLKSLMTSVALPAYMQGRNPAMRVIGISHSSDLAIKFSNDCRVVINDPRYHVFFPRMLLAKNTEAEFHTTLGGYRYARSAEGSLTGIGGDILIPRRFSKADGYGFRAEANFEHKPLLQYREITHQQPTYRRDRHRRAAAPSGRSYRNIVALGGRLDRTDSSSDC